MTENNIKNCKKGSFGWLREHAKKDGFENIIEWQNWKRQNNNIQNVDYIKIYDKKEFTNEERKCFYRFWSHVYIKDIEECWNWIASTNIITGYGQFNIGSNRIIKAHRIAYMLSKGKILEGLQVQHLCNNPLCCNPSHLIVGNHSGNANYMYKCGRKCQNGENNGNVKLTEDQIKQIRKLYKEHKFNQREIADIFRVSNSAIWSIVHKENWKYMGI